MMRDRLPAIAMIAFVFSSVVSSPVAAQEMDHSMHGGHDHQPGMDMPPEPAPVPTKQSPVSPPPPMGEDMHHDDGQHAGMSGHQHEMPESQPADHGMHMMPDGHMMHDAHMGHAMGAKDPPKKPVDARAFSGPEYAADGFYDPAVMAKTRAAVMGSHGNMTVAKFMLDRLETQIVDGKDGYAWEGDAWIGNDENRLWIKSEGEGTFGEPPEQAELQALWSRPVNAWFDVQAGVRHDFRPDPERSYAVVGFEGLLPYWLEVSGALFLSEKGHLSARAEAEYDLRITQRLILQPRVEVNLAARNDRKIGVGAGLSEAEVGLRLRYHITRQFAPYAGVEWQGATGRTRRYMRAEGEDPSRVAAVAGVRFWF